ncbi:MAG: hypothetical protein K2X35_12440 [Bryobacteraceae bacterium]|nr:hypothetical protein [Bryobacteraceae bacterium]
MTPESQAPPEAMPERPAARRSWASILLRVCFAIFTFEVGIFLVVFPWMDAWYLNSLPTFHAFIEDLWMAPAFKSALTGLGLINIYIALVQIFHLRSPNSL